MHLWISWHSTSPFSGKPMKPKQNSTFASGWKSRWDFIVFLLIKRDVTVVAVYTSINIFTSLVIRNNYLSLAIFSSLKRNDNMPYFILRGFHLNARWAVNIMFMHRVTCHVRKWPCRQFPQWYCENQPCWCQWRRITCSKKMYKCVIFLSILNRFFIDKFRWDVC